MLIEANYVSEETAMTDTQDTPTPNTEPGGERGDAGPSRRRRKLLPLGIGALIVAGLGVGLWLSYRPVPDLLQGMVDARELRITSKVTGRIADFHVEEGQPVRAGQLLYTLDSPEVAARSEQAGGARTPQRRRLGAGSGRRWSWPWCCPWPRGAPRR